MLFTISGRIIFSRVFAIGERSEIGLYEEPRLGILSGLRFGIIFPSFQICGIMFDPSDRLYKSVRY